MQTEAQNKALDGAMAALQSTASMDYAKQLLSGTANATSYTPSTPLATANGVELGDFQGQITVGVNGNITLTLTNGPTWFANADANNKTKTLKLFGD